MNEGYIKLFRSLLEWEWYDDINTKVLFIHLLLKANYKDKNWRGIEIKKGELLTSYGNLSIETGLTHKQVRLCLDKLKRTNEIEVNSTNSFSIIKLNNYLKYNGEDTQKGTQKTNEGQTKDTQRATTNKEKNIKKEKNINNKPTKIKIFEEDSFEFLISKDFLYFHIENKTPSIIYQLNNKGEDLIIQEWADEIRKLLLIDNYSKEQIKFIFDFTKNNDFWCKQILSVKKFREKNKDGIPYFIIMINQLKDQHNKIKNNSVTFG